MRGHDLRGKAELSPGDRAHLPEQGTRIQRLHRALGGFGRVGQFGAVGPDYLVFQVNYKIKIAEVQGTE